MSKVQQLDTMDKLFVLLLSVTCAFAFPAPKEPCCFPEQWTGTVSETIGTNAEGSAGSHGGMRTVSINMTTDYTNSRLAMQLLQYDIPSWKVQKYHIIADYKAKKVYMVDLTARTCSVIATPGPMQSRCVLREKKATPYGSLTIGSRSSGIPVTSWGIQMKTPYLEAWSSISLDKSCFPIGEIVTGKANQNGFMAMIGFSDITMGVRDPSVFEVPEICKDVDSSTLSFTQVHPNVMSLTILKLNM